MDILGFIFGGLVGALIGFLLGRHRGRIAVDEQVSAKVALEKSLLATQKDLEFARAGAAQAEQQQQQMVRTFENLSNRYLEQAGGRLREQNSEQLTALVNPLKERIREFQDRVDATNKEDIERTAALKNQIELLSSLNNTITEETRRLTTALRGDNKMVGNFGELILRRLFEASGLQEGTGFTEQGKGLELRTEEGRRQQPDFIVHLPEHRCLIVDAKMSLQSWTAFVNAADDQRENARRDFIASVAAHIRGLGEKSYEQLHGLPHNPEYVILFMPIELSFIEAVRPDSGLYESALEKRIILAGPTTLMAVLRTVAHVWRQQDIGTNAQRIAEEAGSLYDKFAGFLDSMAAIRKSIDQTGDAYDEAMKRLQSGRGNVIGRFEKIRKLGAKNTRQIEERFLPVDDE